jgi:FHA domain-containing protein
MIKCSECGYENMDGLDYCDGCGAKLESAPAHSGDASPPAHTGAPAASEPAGVTEVTAVETPPAATTETDVVAPASAPSGIPAQSDTSNEHSAEVAEPPSAKAPTGEMKTEAVAPPSALQATAAPFKAKLSIIRGGRRGQEFELESGNNLVGRWDPDTGAFPEVDLDADDPEAKVSRKHALIRIDGGKITIEDIGSLNGTYVNRQPRLQPGSPLDLKSGDEIIIGKTFLKLSIDPVS